MIEGGTGRGGETGIEAETEAAVPGNGELLIALLKSLKRCCRPTSVQLYSYNYIALCFVLHRRSLLLLQFLQRRSFVFLYVRFLFIRAACGC